LPISIVDNQTSTSYIGGDQVKNFTISNSGGTKIIVNNIVKENNSSWLTFSPLPPYQLDIGQYQRVNIAVSGDDLEPGIYNDRLIIETSNTNSPPNDMAVSVTLNVVSLHPIANFTGSPKSGLVPLAVTFTDESWGEITDWQWSFPGGNPSFVAGSGPHEVLYDNVGEYNVSLAVVGPDGSDTELKIGYIITGSELKTMDYVYTGPGWYMVSLPVTTQNKNVMDLFPTALGGMAFTWNTLNSTYDSKTEMESKYGYWLAIPGQTSDQIIGIPLHDYFIHFQQQGWYMIGSVIGSTDFSDPDDNPNGQVLSPAFGWNTGTGSYYQTTTLEEKNGYWAAVFGECDLTVGGSGGGFSKSLTQAEEWSAFAEVHGLTPPAPPELEKTTGEMVQIPTTYGLSQNYPNPFNPTTMIQYQLPENGHVSLIVYNMMGQEVKRLIDRNMEAGYHEVAWDGRSELDSRVSSGVYIVMLKAGDYTQTKGMGNNIVSP
ncbi:T9SS type A sorting domain-containing protein, partial [bacterium]|nr:T9SS type A sorting domain-containing protein [bacterium]